MPGAVDLWQIVALAATSGCRDDAMLTNGAGNYATWVHRLYRYGGDRTAARALFSGSMGYGVPSAIAAKARPSGACRRFVERRRLLSDERPGACNRGSVWTANVVFVVIDNGMYGTIRMHQERHYPGRVSRYRFAQSGFRAARARLWCVR